ncbi:MAG: isochorismate synthase [Candidatus Hydrogenedentes bacterium]|nr:isochorismate synthase [Candidatus Hydrogenedentota bacterium]
MTLLFPDTVEHGEAKQALAAMIQQAFESAHARGVEKRRVLRAEVPVEDVVPLQWLEAQGNRSRGYWCDRDREYELAGAGTADILSADAECDYDELIDRLRNAIAAVHPNLRYFGGMRFSQRSPIAGKWQPFGAYRFVLPRFEVLNRGAQSYLACNAIVEPNGGDELGKVLEALEAMPFPGDASSAPIPVPTRRIDTTDRARWSSEIDRALQAFSVNRLKKVVLAREVVFEFEEVPDPVALLRKLAQDAQHCAHFCFQPKYGAAFIGASPERLYKRQSRYVLSEAVAATRPRGATDAEDAALEAELLASDKDIREHRFVRDSVCADLGARCKTVHVDKDLSVLKLPNVQHLCTRIEGILEQDNTDADLLRTLHPTPAVGGLPKEGAVRWIAEAEPFDRGWFAGPVGWISGDGAEFAVGIRSGLVSDKTLSVYAGAGIVPGSVAEEEWTEIENKLSPFLGILTKP